MQLTLNDFDCKDPPPKWLPQEKWEDILALSVLPGPLDSLCVHMAQNSDTWKSWYTSDYPEREPLPVASAGGEEGKGNLLWTEFVKLRCFSVNLEKDSDLQGIIWIITICLYGILCTYMLNNSTDKRPSSGGSRNSQGNGMKTPDLGPLSDFHQLLLLRMLRQDRLPAALVRYVNKHLTINLPEQTDFK